MSDIKIVGQIDFNTGDAAKKIEDVKKGLNETGEAAKKVSNNNKEAGGSFNNLKENLTSISPTANAASESFGGFNNALNLIKANPIIGVLAGLAAIIIGLFSKFSKMEGVSDSLGKAWSQLSGIFSGFINKILTPLIDGFTALVDLFTNGLISILDTLGITSKDTADRMGELAESLDDLEDAQKDSAIAAAESNRKLQEARELAADANVPIKERIKALREASKIENEELTKIVEINTTKAKLMLEQIALELNARGELIAKIREGSLESLKAARAEMMAMKNIDKEKITGIDQMIIAAEDAASKRSKIGTKTEKQISSLEKEEEDKRESARKDAAAAAAAARQKENDERVQREQETQQRLKEVLVAGQKAIDDALKVLRVQNRQTELAELKKKFDEDVAAANNAGFSTLRIREAFQKQQDEINFKYDEEARLKKEGEAKLLIDRKKAAAELIKDEVAKLNQLQVIADEERNIELKRLQDNINATKKGTQARADAEIAYNEKKQELDIADAQRTQQVDAIKLERKKTANLSFLQNELDFNNLKKTIADAEIEDAITKSNRLIEIANNEHTAKINLLTAQRDAEILAAEQMGLDTSSIKQKYQTQIQAADAAHLQTTRQLSQAIVDTKVAEVETVGNLAKGLSAVINQESAAGKVAAIALATIDTFVAAWRAFTNAQKNPISILGPAYPYISAAAAAAAGIANIKKIASVQVPGASGGASVPNASIAASAPILPQQTSTSLDSNTIQNIGNAAAGGVNRAYVVSSDIARDREREAQLNRAARL